VKHLCSRLIAVACAGFVSIICFAQSAPTFTSERSASGPTPSHLYAVDVNNDGLTDIIQDTAQPGTTGSFFAVSINKDKGKFNAPVTYKINSNTWTPITWGDFNKDGHVDIAVVLPSNQVSVYLGNGDGTFQAPITTTVDLPAGTAFSAAPQSTIAAADFNHDGNVDLVAAAYVGDYYSGPWEIYLLEGDGTGRFHNLRAIYYPTSGWTVQTIIAGDFDTDNNADVALLESMPCSGGGVDCSSNIVALFGDGGANFEAVDVTTVNGNMSLGAADLNNDGATDLYGIEYGSGSPQLAVFRGHYDRRFSYWFTAIPSSIPNVGQLSAVADFSGTGKWVLAGLWATYPTLSTPNNQMVYFLNAGTPNVSIVTSPSPAGVAGWQTGPVVGDFNGDTKPGIAVNESSTLNSAASTLGVGVNDNPRGFYGACSYPSSGQGIHLCSPTAQTTHGPITFEASANSFGQFRKIELWLDGVKLGEDHWIWGQSGYFDLYYPNPSPGTHNATIYAADIDNTLQRYDFTFIVDN
jgi:FG-GAP-like repeat